MKNALQKYLLYYVSAYFTHTLDPFFVHVTIGQDFFQIPNAAYAFLHGGTLTGGLPYGLAPYINCCSVNPNVYHPLFTLLIGVPLQLLPPWTAMTVWAVVHIIVMAILVVFLRNKFRTHPYLYLALGLLLINPYNYYEIALTQYQFLFNFFTTFFLYEVMKKGDTTKAGVWLLLSLLVKPIGLLWIIPLLLYKRQRTVAIGLGIYAGMTILFSLFPFGQYYLKNFLFVSTATAPSHNIYAIVHLIPTFPLQYIKAASIMIAIGLILLQIKKRPNLFILITLWVGFQLIFYTLSYHYQYSILGGLFCLGMLLNIVQPTKIELFLLLFINIPAPALVLTINRLSTTPNYAPVWLYNIFWLVCFLVYLITQTVRGNKRFADPEDHVHKNVSK